MASIMDKETRKEVKKILDHLKNPVKLLFFTQKNECPLCRHQHELVDELSAISDKITLEVYDFVKDRDKVAKYQIMMARKATNIPKRKRQIYLKIFFDFFWLDGFGN